MILNHPRIPNVTVDVPDSDVEQWQASGWQGDGADDPRPAGNASRDEWVAYALAHGADEETVEDASRDDLRETYGD